MTFNSFNLGQNMRLALTLLLISLFSIQAFAAGQNELPFYSKFYDEKRDPFKDATDAIALAQKTDRNVLIEIGGNWCTWCKKMDAFLEENRHVYEALHQKYVLLKISVSDSNENEAFMKSLPPVLGYPHMYISTASGKMLLSKDTAELLEGNNYSEQRWLTFLNKWQASANMQNIASLTD